MSVISLEDQLVIAIQLALAAFLSGIIGLDRERLSNRAGLRTYMLLGVGACLFTALSEKAFPGSDTSRVASQIVVGIGFLGAGTILKDRGEIHGLTTAAAMWATAAIGMAVGVGAWLLAIIATIFIWFILAVVIHVERDISKREPERSSD